MVIKGNVYYIQKNKSVMDEEKLARSNIKELYENNAHFKNRKLNYNNLLY